MNGQNKSKVFCRKSAHIHDFGKFKPISDNFTSQFCNVYKTRLNLLKKRLMQKVQLKWDSKYPVVDIVDLANNDSNMKSIIIGTLYKQQKLKPSIFKEICNELQAPVQPSNFSNINYSSPNDCLFLEDDIQRIKLTGNCCIKKVVTGIICAVLGEDLKNGEFLVDEWCFPGHNLEIFNPVTYEPSQSILIEESILLVSGLNFANNVDSMSLNLFKEWVMGMAGNKREQEKNSKLITVIIAGNSLRNENETFNRDKYFEKNCFNSTAITDVMLTTKKFDDFLSQILETCCVILMPGEFDLTSHLMPQHSLHSQIVPKSSRFNTLYGVTNPWIGKIESRVIAGSSGQPISDIMKLADVECSAIDWMEKTILWQHFAPTSPDTLDIYPYYDGDPFVMQDDYDIYFAGNMDKYETKLLTDNKGQKIRLICIPQFSKSQTAVLVNLNTLDANAISFGTNL